MKVLTGVRPFRTITAGEAEELMRQGAELEVSRKAGIIYRERQNHITKEKQQ